MIGQFKCLSPPVQLLTVQQLHHLFSLKKKKKGQGGKKGLLFVFCTWCLILQCDQIRSKCNSDTALYFSAAFSLLLPPMGGISVQERVGDVVIGSIRERCSVHVLQVFLSFQKVSVLRCKLYTTHKTHMWRTIPVKAVILYGQLQTSQNISSFWLCLY